MQHPSIKTFSFEEPDYGKYENYLLFNFSLMAPVKQVDFFYVRDFSPVEKEAHYDGLSMDCDYNANITNPVYQLFVSGFLYANDFMALIGEIFDDDAFWKIERLMAEVFSPEFQQAFFEDVYFNTSIDGFLHGAYWKDVRESAKRILDECDLHDEISFNNPMKFRGFLYPDDFNEYKAIPYWSRYGEVVSFEDWRKLKKTVFKNYEQSRLRFPGLITSSR